MGIRFYCQACEKRLNVKGFLAGKRGVCPHCGAKVDIPWQSQSKPAEVAAAAVAAPRSVSPAVVPTGPRESHAAPINGHSYGGPAIASPVVVQPLAVVASVTPVAVSQVPIAAPVSAAVVAAPPPSAPPDPIAEAPSAVWYVRPPSGGQYGPASGEIMRKWIAEGRVSSDSLIWREGWPDWKTAASQFPEMAGAAAPRVGSAPSFPAQPLLSSPIESPASRTGARRKKNQTMIIVVVASLALLSAILIAVLLVAVFGGFGNVLSGSG